MRQTKIVLKEQMDQYVKAEFTRMDQELRQARLKLIEDAMYLDINVKKQIMATMEGKKKKF